MPATSPSAPPVRLARALALLVAVLAAVLLPTGAFAADADDRQPPVLSEGVSSPFVVVQGSVATATFRLADAGSGAVVPTVSATAQAEQGTTRLATVRRISGDARDGVYEASVAIEAGDVGGLWDFTALPLRDYAGNEAPAPAPISSFFVLGLGWDTTPPVLVGSAILPSSVDLAAGPGTVLVTLRATDDYTGVFPPFVEAVAPDGTIVVSASARVSGTKNDGVWAAKLTIPALSPTGAWTVRTQPLRDEQGNARAAGDTLGTVAVVRTPAPTGTGGAPTGGTPGSAPGSTDQGGVLGTRAASRSYLSFAGKRSRVAVTRKGSLAFAVRCNGQARCRGSIRLYVKVRGKRVKVVSRRITVAAGRTTKATFKLTKRGRVVVRRGKTVKTSLRLYTDGIKAPRTKALTFKRA